MNVLFRSGLISLGLALTLSACGFEETYTGLGDQALGWPSPDAGTCPACVCTGGGGDADAGGEGEVELPDLTGFGYRFDSLALDAPLTGFLATSINGYFRDSIAADELHILLRVQADDREAGTLLFDLGPGAPSDAGYTFSAAPSPLPTALTATGFRSTEPSNLDFPNVLLVPPALPIVDLRLSAKVAPQGAALLNGRLEGALREEDAAGIALGGTDFRTFLQGAQVPLDLDLDGDGTPDAWRFSGSYSAAQADVAAAVQP